MMRSIIAILGFQNVRLRTVNSGVLEANFSRLMTLDDVLLLPFQGWSLWNFVTRLLDECNRVVGATNIELSTLKGKCLQFLHNIVVGCFGEREGLVVVSGPDAWRSKTRGYIFSETYIERLHEIVSTNFVQKFDVNGFNVSQPSWFCTELSANEGCSFMTEW
jgi:hypothetical protein